ncbi:ABC transporter permease [Synoicihabitans lomoniglobus]|uniref:ABC transporter permease n=1 Tax=Synoicihabitans lomoniglobus TaxID=2909285 RepID=A0AAF0CMJ6_9BACT|nr:ABC transporter permease [Opitutaceae bacterium LMO-M01]WED63366.1 ABC transporter permease [Opitutaceae bacterium LMO-M01]
MLKKLTSSLVNAGPLIGLIVICALFAALRWENFVTWDNFAIILQQTAVIGIAALGMTIVIIAGGIDLSVGSIIALGTIVIALALQAGWPPLAAALAGIAVCGACGGISGLLITRLRLMPFVVTLGMMGALRGAAKGLADQQPIYPDDYTWISELMQLGEKGSLPGGVWLMLGFAALVAAMLRYTRFGRHVFAVGSNENTARLCGVPVERVKVLVYIIGAAFAGLGAMLQFGYLTGGDPTTAVGLELNIIAAVVIGGASLAGGQGTVMGTLVGALIMSVVANGCTKLGMANWVQEMVTGGIIVAAVTLDALRRRSRA